jgi:small-conductance mechanosensitive channel
MCVSGSLLRAGSGAFAVGDRIEMGGVRGDVIDSTLLTTTLLEVGPTHLRTGRAVVVPNSALLSGTVVNETFMDQYVVHVMTIPVGANADWEHAERVLLEAAREVCGEHVEPARRFMDALSRRHALPELSVEPRVLVSIPKPDEVGLVLRVPTPVRERGRVEQQILRGYLARRAAAPPPA